MADYSSHNNGPANSNELTIDFSIRPLFDLDVMHPRIVDTSFHRLRIESCNVIAKGLAITTSLCREACGTSESPFKLYLAFES